MIFLFRIVLSVILLSAPSIVHATDNASPSVGFSWIHGVCKSCQIAHGITDVRFLRSREAWAVGGAGNYSIVHTRDGGRTWVEIPGTYMHNDPPSVSFSNSKEGWVRIEDIPNAELKLLQTHDYGRHWRRLSLQDLFVQHIEYFGHGAGYAYGFDIYKKNGYLYTTLDSGQHWKALKVSGGIYADQMAFSDPRHGLVAGCIGRHLRVLRTSDAGRRWSRAEIALPLTALGGDDCNYQIDDLNLRKDGVGWLVVNQAVFGPNERAGVSGVWRTFDGGASWALVLRETFPVRPGSDTTSAARFTGAISLGSHLDVIAREDGVLVYSADGAKTWRNMSTGHPIGRCHPFGVGLKCAGGLGDDFWVLSLVQMG